MRIVFIILLLFPLVVFSQEKSDLVVDVNGSDGDEVIFELPGGSRESFEIFIENNSDDIRDIRISVTGDDVDLVENTRFFDSSLDESLRTSLEENKNDVVAFCDKRDSEDISRWCEGVQILDITLEPEGKQRIIALVDIGSDQEDHAAQLIIDQKNARDEYEKVVEKRLQYRMPEKNTTTLRVSDFILEKDFGPLDVQSWLSANMRELHRARYFIENTGVQDVEYTYYAKVLSKWIGEEIYFEEKDNVLRAEKKENKLELTVPRFGKMQVIGGVKYFDHSGTEQEVQSEPIEFFVWPATLSILVILCGCFCVISVLLYKYIIKNMFRFKKKKEKKDGGGFGGKYIVQDADNIISIAQRYDVAWKELAKQNDIEPPYILISGETIKVPGPAAQSEEVDDEKKSVADQWTQKTSSDAGIKKESGVRQDDVQRIEAVDNDVEKQGAAPQQVLAESAGTVSQKSDVVPPEVGDDKQGSGQVKKKKRKVSFASPKNMLTKPSSEPTTRAIDIEWMRDDEIAYMEEMEVQEKKTSRKFIIVIVLAVITGGILIWYGVMWFMQRGDVESVSVDTLINEQVAGEQQQDLAVESDSEQIDVASDEDKGDKDEEATESDEDADNEDKSSDQENDVSANEDVSVQVLNAGAAAGAAGSVSDAIGEVGFKMETAQNAQNDYENVVIYYKSGFEASANAVASEVDEKYGEQKIEESDDVTKTYDVDVVVVLGA